MAGREVRHGFGAVVGLPKPVTNYRRPTVDGEIEEQYGNGLRNIYIYIYIKCFIITSYNL